MFRAPLPQSPSVLSTPQLSRGRVSAGSHHQSAKSSRPPGCLGPSSAGGCAPKAPGGRGPSPLSVLPGHSHPSSSRDAAPSTQLWTRMDLPKAGTTISQELGGRQGRPRRRCSSGRQAGTRTRDRGTCTKQGIRPQVGPREPTGFPEGTRGWEGPGAECGVSRESGGRGADRSRSCPQVRAWEGGDRDRCRPPPGPEESSGKPTGAVGEPADPDEAPLSKEPFGQAPPLQSAPAMAGADWQSTSAQQTLVQRPRNFSVSTSLAAPTLAARERAPCCKKPRSHVGQQQCQLEA